MPRSEKMLSLVWKPPPQPWRPDGRNNRKNASKSGSRKNFCKRWGLEVIKHLPLRTGARRYQHRCNGDWTSVFILRAVFESNTLEILIHSYSWPFFWAKWETENYPRHEVLSSVMNKLKIIWCLNYNITVLIKIQTICIWNCWQLRKCTFWTNNMHIREGSMTKGKRAFHDLIVQSRFRHHENDRIEPQRASNTEWGISVTFAVLLG